MSALITSTDMDCLRDKFAQDQLLDGRYLTVAPLNHGSFGMVFLAKDIKTGEHVAIKCLTKPSSADPACPLSVDERSEELDCHERLGSHPNLVNKLHSFETNSHIFLVLEYCSMGDLYEAIKNNRGPLETEHVRDFMLQLIDAVEYMHAKGLYHRDIKPENIFLCQDSTMKLGDFGLATRSSWSFEASVGSDRYMAPEQYDPTPAGYSTAQADIWSIGICLLNVLFARNPFVTPTESDVLFADYARDRQSLFDVFPNMSQDTFEILSHSLTLDPKKRSLSAIREAVLRAVSFTTDEETLDEFCTEDRNVVPASAYREPLRTPSIQSPQMNQGDSFPWAKALQATPQQPVRELSVIPDTETYDEDLFPASEMDGTSWHSALAGSHSTASALGSAAGASFGSIPIRRPNRRFVPSTGRIPISGSLPITASKPIPAMSMVFGKAKAKANQVSKSWSDLWDEEEMENDLLIRQEQNARTWSQDSKDADIVSRPPVLSEIGATPLVNSRPLPEDPVGPKSVPIPAPRMSPFAAAAADQNQPGHGPRGCPRHSPRQKQTSSIMDKWAALGDKRRNHHPDELESPRPPKESRRNSARRKDNSFDSPTNKHRYRVELLNKDWRRDAGPSPIAKVKKQIPAPLPAANFDTTLDDDFDWIGGWHDLHI